MKRYFGLVMTFLMVLMVIQPITAATKAVNIEINGKLFDQPNAYIEKGRTMVPLAFFDQLAKKITINQETIALENDYLTINFTIGSKIALVHHKYDFTGIPAKIDLEVAPQRINEVIFLPLRFTAETLSARVIWDQPTKTIKVLTESMLKNPIQFSVIDPSLVRMTQELSDWYYKDTEVKGIEYKAIGDVIYIKVQAGEKPTGGYSVAVNGVYDLGNGSIYLDTAIIAPNPDDMVIQVISYPSALIAIQGSELPSGITEIIGEVN